jgi:CheY-like chemotaxis protein
MDTRSCRVGYSIKMTDQHVILVVDDEPEVRETIVAMLAECGLQIIEAADAKGALARFKEHPEICVVFTDVTMPGALNGCDLAQEVKTLRPDVKVILTSGRGLPQDYHLPHGVIFIPKPYSPLAISQLLSHMLS